MEEWTTYLLLSVFFTVIVILFLRRGSSRDLPLPPGPRSLPVLGNLLELGQNPHRSLACLARTHGPVMYLQLGRIYTVVISSPSSSKEVLKTKVHYISGRQIPNVLQAFGHHEVSVVWSPPNQSWRYLRTLMKTHLFSTQSLDANQLLHQRKVPELIAYIRGKEGEVVRIAQAAFCTVLNLICTTFLSTDMVYFKSKSAQELKDFMWGMMEEAGRPNFFPFLAPIDLQTILKETLRLHPPAPLLLPHKAEASTEINGYLVPKNSQVLVNVWAIGRDQQVWENPDRFLPEMFLEGAYEIDFRGQHFELTPFGSGRRICPGLPLGVRMVQLMLASFIQSFEWSLPEGMEPKDLDLREKFGLTLVMASPLEAMATPANQI